MRGQITNTPRKKQIVDFSQIRYKNITPTDTDGGFEIQGKVFVFIELKLDDTPVLLGQKLYLERLCDNLRIPAVTIVAEHQIWDVEEVILAHECIVREYYSNRNWRKPASPLLLQEVIDSFLKLHGLQEYIGSKTDVTN